MVISALSYCPGYHIVEDLGFIYAFDDKMMLSRTVDRSVEEAQNALSQKAQKRGANAVLNVHIEIADNSRVLLCGEAVILQAD